MNLYSLVSFDCNSRVEWLFTHIEKKSKEQFEQDVETLISHYKEEYFKINANNNVSGYDLINFISTKLNELGYTPIEPITCSYAGDNIQDLSEKLKQMSDKFLVSLCRTRYDKTKKENL